MSDLRSIRKSKGLTMEQLADKSGVSSKTISLYECTPPKRPSRKVIDKISGALEISPDVLLGMIGPKEKASKCDEHHLPEETVELADAQVARVLGLLDKEIMELRYLMIEAASLAGEHPSLAKSIDYLSADIDLLIEIKQRFS